MYISLHVLNVLLGDDDEFSCDEYIEGRYMLYIIIYYYNNI